MRALVIGSLSQIEPCVASPCPARDVWKFNRRLCSARWSDFVAELLRHKFYRTKGFDRNRLNLRVFALNYSCQTLIIFKFQKGYGRYPLPYPLFNIERLECHTCLLRWWLKNSPMKWEMLRIIDSFRYVLFSTSRRSEESIDRNVNRTSRDWCPLGLPTNDYSLIQITWVYKKCFPQTQSNIFN